MNTDSTITYPQSQAIEPTLKSKKSNVLTGIGFVLFIGGIGLGYLGLKVFDFSHVVGIIVTFSGIPFFIVGHRLSPVCEFPKKEYDSSKNDWNRDYHHYYSTSSIGSLNYKYRD